MENTRRDRVLEIFFRGLRGEDLSVQRLADEYKVSTKSVTRSLNDLKAFLADHRDLVGNTELQYSHQDKCYRLYMDEFLSNKELFALVEVMIGARAFSKEELLELTSKLKRFTTPEDRAKLNELVRKELYHYPEVKHDCDSVQEYPRLPSSMSGYSSRWVIGLLHFQGPRCSYFWVFYDCPVPVEPCISHSSQAKVAWCSAPA